MNYDEQLDLLITNALTEDIGGGDHSTISTISADAEGKAVLKIKEDGVLAGIEVAEKIFKKVQANIVFTVLKKDGDTMLTGESAFEVAAKVHTILTCERLVLNTMQRMSGIATLTRKYVEKLAGYHTQLLDTRNTTPNFRLLEKEAVRIGGAINHRMGLYDMIMLKDNHIDYCGGIEKAIVKAYDYVQAQGLDIKIEVETRNLEDVQNVVATGKVNRIMLDNFSPAQIADALKIIDGQYETEASGGINYNNLERYAATGVDYISSGAVIHQAVSLDLSLKAIIYNSAVMAKRIINKSGVVYSTNPDFKMEDYKEEEIIPVAKGEQLIKVRLETKHRAGKAVTFIDNFIGSGHEKEDIGKVLKAFCGTGGSVKDGEIIVQGDHRDKILQWLQKNGYSKAKKI